MHTEQDARTRWCPFARTDGTNRMSAPDGDTFFSCCITSKCMAWRWANDADGEPAYKRRPVDDVPGHFDNEPLGYCGLAGEPRP